MPQNFRYSRAKPSHASAIVEFQIAMARETEGLELNRSTLEEGVRAVFEDEKRGHYWIAEHKEVVIGSLLLLSEWSDWRNGFVWWIHSVFVKSEYRRQGVYKGLYQTIQEVVKNDPQSHGLRLYVEKENLRAQKVYENLGMDGSHYRMFQWMKTF